MPTQFRSCCGTPYDSPHTCRATPLDPPRFCARCGRRLVVQVLPLGWTARCSSCGEVHG